MVEAVVEELRKNFEVASQGLSSTQARGHCEVRAKESVWAEFAFMANLLYL